MLAISLEVPVGALSGCTNQRQKAPLDHGSACFAKLSLRALSKRRSARSAGTQTILALTMIPNAVSVVIIGDRFRTGKNRVAPSMPSPAHFRRKYVISTAQCCAGVTRVCRVQPLLYCIDIVISETAVSEPAALYAGRFITLVFLMNS